jgi:hypothetical protein
MMVDMRSCYSTILDFVRSRRHPIAIDGYKSFAFFSSMSIELRTLPRLTSRKIQIFLASRNPTLAGTSNLNLPSSSATPGRLGLPLPASDPALQKLTRPELIYASDLHVLARSSETSYPFY